MLKNINLAILTLMISAMPVASALAEGEAHHSSGGLPQFDPTSWPSQIFWLAVFFVTLYFVFGKSVIPTLGKTIEDRQSYVADNLRQAESLSNEAEALRAKVEAELKSASHQAGQSVSAAEADSKAKITGALAEFRTRYEQQVAETEARLQAAKSAAMVDMEQIAARLAAQAAEKIAGIPASESGAENVVKSLSQKAKLAA